MLNRDYASGRAAAASGWSVRPAAVAVPLSTPAAWLKGSGIPESIPAERAGSAPAGIVPHGLGVGFAGISFADELTLGGGTFPPDTSGAIGPSHFVEMTGGAVAVYNRSGTRLGLVSLMSFFAYPGGYPRIGAIYPRVLFDRLSGRWFACVLETSLYGEDGNGNNAFLAVSRTSDPTGTWDKYLVAVERLGEFNVHTTLGVDSNGVYMGYNVSMVAKLAVTRKSTLLGSPGSLTAPQVFTIAGMWASPQPAQNLQANGASDPAWVVSSSPAVFSNVDYATIAWSGGIASLSATSELTTPTYLGLANGAMPEAPALGSGTNVHTGDDRIQSAVISDGRLWTTRTVGVNGPAGGTTGSPDRTACEWLSLDITGGTTAALDQSGRVFDTAASGPRFYYYPSVVVNGQGHVLMGFSGSKASEYVGAYASSRLASDPAGTMGGPQLIAPGLAAYTRLDGVFRNRWGDYSSTSLDPADNMTLWTVQERASGTANYWGTWVAPYTSPAPTLDMPSPVPSVVRGATGASFSLTGTGLYDPGAAFTGRLQASISGDGISNLAVAYNSPTSVTLTFDVSASATLGPRDVTVANPDGQTAGLSGAISIGTNSQLAVGAVSGKPTQTVDLTATLTLVDGGGPIVGHSVAFKVDGSDAGSATTNGSGVATLAYTIPVGSGAGDRPIVADFAAAGGYAPCSGSGTLTVVKANTGLSFYGSYGELGGSALLKVVLGGGMTGVMPLAGRTVSFAVEGVSAGTATTDSNGIASLAYDIPMGLGTGAHNVSATYDGSADPAFNGTTREAAVLTVIKAGTGISLYNVQGRLGGSVQLRAVLVSKGAAVAGRTVSFAVGGAAVGSATTDSSGVASVTYAIPLSLGTGAHNVTATFDGTADTTYRDSSVTGAALSVIKAATGVTFYAAQGVQYTHVDLRCVLFGAGVRLPGKTVAFYVDNVYVASGVTNGAGVAGVTHYIGGAAPGLHAVRCVFDGSADPRYASTTRTESVLTVDPL